MVKIVESYDRDRREKREKTKEALDITMIGLVKKKKKHIKPAYKKKSAGKLTSRRES